MTLKKKSTRAISSAQDDPILTLTEAATRLGKHRSTISRWIKEGVVIGGKDPSGLPGIRESQVNRILREFPV